MFRGDLAAHLHRPLPDRITDVHQGVQLLGVFLKGAAIVSKRQHLEHLQPQILVIRLALQTPIQHVPRLVVAAVGQIDLRLAQRIALRRQFRRLVLVLGSRRLGG